MSLKVGDAVEGRYKILRELDQGGMGSVFLAEHQLIKRRVALKLLRADLAEDADVLERFMNEARAAGTLGHPNIVESTDMGFTRDGVPYIVFEFLEGALLTDEIYRVRGLPVRRALRIARQIASALNAAHAAGIVHRDLKSDNVFLTDRDGQTDHVKVLDFGISRFIEAEDSPEKRSMVIGTPQFMAPEQITNPEAVDQRTDVYALGVILYEMLSAARPFENEEDPDALFKSIVEDAAPPFDVPDLPPGLETMIRERFLAKDPAERFSSMADVEAALSAFAGIVRPPGRDSQPLPVATVQAMIGESPAKMVSLPPPPPRRGNLGWLIAAVMAAIAGGALFVAEPKATTQDGSAVVKADADRIVATLDSAIKNAQTRVEGLAQAPQLRASVETDAATVADLLRNEFQLKLAPRESLELLQIKDGALVPLYTVPENTAFAVRMDHQPRVDNGRLIASTSVAGPRGGATGAIALATPIDLSPVIADLTAHTEGAQVTGLGKGIALVPWKAGGNKLALPLAVPAALGVQNATLEVALPQVAPPRSFAGLRLCCFGLAGLLAIVYAVNLLRARRPG
ncbi:MAG: serine/threonine-protein kinase [Kofleriaceae bacterium]